MVGDYGGFAVVDVANPDSPTESAFVWMTDVGYDITVQGDYAYVANDWEGLYIYDLSNLPSITWVGFHDTDGKAWRLSLESDTAYIADQDGGIYSFDVTNPAVIGMNHRFFDRPIVPISWWHRGSPDRATRGSLSVAANSKRYPGIRNG